MTGKRAGRVASLDDLLDWAFAWLRCALIVFVALPISALYELMLNARNRFIFAVGSATRSHGRKVAQIQRQVRLWASTSNKSGKMYPIEHTLPKHLRASKDVTAIRVGTLVDILEIDTDKLRVRVEPMITMGELSRVLIPLGYCVPIVHNNKEMTVQDAINGYGVGASGRKYGLFQHICHSYELVMPDGSVVVASKDKSEAAGTQALYYGVPWSEGTLGILVAVTLRMIPIKPYVKLTYTPVQSVEEMRSKLVDECECRENEYVEGMLFSNNLGVVLRGRFSEGPPRNWGAVNMIGRWYKQSFYSHVQEIVQTGSQEHIEFVPLREFYHRHWRSLYWELKDYIPFCDSFLFRWFVGWMCPPRLDVIKMVIPTALKSRLDLTHIRKDVLIPLERLEDCVNLLDEQLNVYPLCLSPFNQPSCPGLIRQRSGRNVLFVNVGVYGCTQNPDIDPKAATDSLEEFARNANGVTVVHEGTQMSRSDFWQMFDSSLYEWLRVKYNCKEAFLDVYEKVRSTSNC